ncbi:MAG: SsrA-binding protein SmpB [Thermoleophilaceae bacterium]|nr:SsrA-binding protein SmpB [Thermoleophilaceae bacterium]
MSKQSGGRKKTGAAASGAPGTVANNRQAGFRYELVEKYEAGIALLGSEVKSLRASDVTMKDAYASFDNGELWLHNLHIAPYPPAAQNNHPPERPRKLLLNRIEIDRIQGKLAEKGLTMVATRIYFKGNKAKVEVALGRGKDAGDKRQGIKEREMKRDMDRARGDFLRGR